MEVGEGVCQLVKRSEKEVEEEEVSEGLAEKEIR